MDLAIDLSVLVSVLPAWAISILAVIGTLHLVVPPVQTAVESVVRATTTKKDDEIYDQVVQSKYYALFLKAVKYISGLDLKKKK